MSWSSPYLNQKLATSGLNILRSTAPTVFIFVITLYGVQKFSAINWGQIIELQMWMYLIVFIAGWGNKDFLLRKYSASPQLIARNFSRSATTRLFLLVPSLAFFFFYSAEVAGLVLLIIVVRYVHNSLDSLIIYNKTFKLHLIAEFCSTVILLGFLIGSDSFEVSNILMFFLLAETIKTTFILLRFRNEFQSLKFDIIHIQLAFPFFLIGFSGWIQSRIDMYVIDQMMDTATLANYRILSNSFLMVQSISALAVYPYVKQLYRAKSKTVNQLSVLVIKLSIPIVVFSTVVIYLIFSNLKELALDPSYYIVAASGALPAFLYILDVYQFYKAGKEKIILHLNIIGAIVNLLLAVLGTYLYGFIGALIANTISQWLLLIAFKKYKPA